MNVRHYWILFCGSLVLGALLSGCAVPQKPGNGRVSKRTEPITKTDYWLYLPEDYIKTDGHHPQTERWPLVMTFHGLRPYDDAKPQIREWQQEADRYGMIVVAPELRTCDSLTMQFPLRDPTLPYVRKDEQAIMAIMDEVFRETNADPNRVLVTSFSSGGYIAHYMVNRHPERFSCLAVRGSNFSPTLLSTGQIPRYQHMPVAIYWGENDFKVCREESIEAVDWYRQHNFDVDAKYVDGLGHERRPETAAAFFASTIDVLPKTAPPTGTLVMRDYPDTRSNRSKRFDRSDSYSAARHDFRTPARSSDAAQSRSESNVIFNQTPQRNRPPRSEVTQVAPREGVQKSPATIREEPNKTTHRRRVPHQPYSIEAAPPAPRIERRRSEYRPPQREQLTATTQPAS